MEFRLLGPVEVWDGSKLVALGGPKPRILLSALLLNHGRVVPTARLVDDIWGRNPPVSAKALVQTYVASLRRTLRAGGSGLIITRSSGYLLLTRPENIDLCVFEQLAAVGRQASASGRHEEAGELLSAALALWRGPALSGAQSELLASEAARLDEMYLTVLEERIAVDLLRCRHEDLVSELTALVRRHPTREALRRHLMVALYRCERQVDALRVYREGREVLVEELGVEPGRALRAVHEAILRSDDGALKPPPSAPPLLAAIVEPAATSDDTDSPREPKVPAQLPAVPGDFTGRTAQIDELLHQLAPRSALAAPPTVLITGKAGVGKSTLAVRVAHELAPSYVDGQLFVQLHGMTPTPVLPEAILARFLEALGDPGEPPTSLEGRIDRYRTLMAGRRILVVLDDVATEQQVRPLLPGSPTCAVLITARSRLLGLAAAHRVELDVLVAEEARQLLALVAGPDRVEVEADAANRLTELCGGLPLAVRIVGTRVANRRHWSVGQLVGRLDDDQRRLNELRVGDQEVRASISTSYRTLDVQARAAFRRLGLLSLPDFPPWIVAALVGVDDDDAEQILERLVDGHFIDFVVVDGVGQARYHLHDLFRLYAAERAMVEDDQASRDAAVRRVLNGWLWLIDQVGAGYRGVGIVLRPGTQPSGYRLPDVSAAMQAHPRVWFEVEQYGLLASVERAAAMGLDDIAADLASALGDSPLSTGNLATSCGRRPPAATSMMLTTSPSPWHRQLLPTVRTREANL